jgi:glycosyltransferase involved in cell wall biosynthesis
LFSDDRSPFAGETFRQLPQADVYTLHWLGYGFCDFSRCITKIPARAPVVWRLSDQNPFTGGCHYDSGCERWKDSCGACPQLGSHLDNDLSRQVWTRKRRALDAVPAPRFHIVAQSRWMAQCVSGSSLFGRFPLSHIPNGLDTEVFKPRDRALARDILQVPADAKTVLFVADLVANRRKGIALLYEALAGLRDVPNLFLLSAGQGTTPPPQGLPGRHLDSVSDERWLSLAYCAADVFVIPSLQDNLPNTVLEAMACGTPVVGFDVGGIPDMVRHSVTGLLVPAGDVAELARALRGLLGDAARRAAMGAACRRVALAEYTLEKQARAYLALYEGLLSSRDADGPERTASTRQQ